MLPGNEEVWGEKKKRVYTGGIKNDYDNNAADYNRCCSSSGNYDNAISAVYHISGRKRTTGCDYLKDVPESTHFGLPELIAILFIVVLHKWKKSTLLSIGGGTVLYMVLVQTIFG